MATKEEVVEYEKQFKADLNQKYLPQISALITDSLNEHWPGTFGYYGELANLPISRAQAVLEQRVANFESRLNNLDDATCHTALIKFRDDPLVRECSQRFAQHRELLENME